MRVRVLYWLQVYDKQSELLSSQTLNTFFSNISNVFRELSETLIIWNFI